MTEEDAFLADIIETPDDDLPRMVYGDWLADRGDPRGEFIHVQCLLCRVAEDDPRRPRLEAREGELLGLHQDGWLGPLRPLLSRWTFRRGFLDVVAVPAGVHLANAAIAWPATVRRVEVDLAAFEVPLETVEFVPESVARENTLLPIGFRGRTLVLAMKEPKDAGMLEKLEFILNRGIEPVASPPEQITEAIDRHYGQSETESVECVLVEFPEVALDPDADREAVAKLVDLIIAEAVALYADQIRLEQRHDGVRVSYRIGRHWAERDTPPRRLFELFVGRIKVLAGIGPGSGAERQTGRMKVGCDSPFGLEVVVQPADDGPEIMLTFIPPMPERVETT
jgi:uncharacterized protein (TIGR02996 family)